MLNLEADSSPHHSDPRSEGCVDAAGETDIGRERTVNEDAFLIGTLQRSMVVHAASPPGARGWFGGGPAGTMLVVADGMGGQGGGDVASNVAVSAVARYLLDVMPWTPFAPHTIAPQASLPGVRDRLSSALVAGDSRIKNLAAATATPHMGSTLTVALVLWPLLYVAHVGDTRCYLLRSGNLRQLTTDHTMAQVMAQAEAEPVASGSHLHHILWNALGGNDDVPKPEITRVALELGDVLLLCSDGLTKHVTDAQIAAVLAVDESTAVRCRKLVELANLNGGSDNVTVIVAVPNTAMTAPTGTTAG